jgi:Male sterility protein/haloacid dehalogenase-like hydrolase
MSSTNTKRSSSAFTGEKLERSALPAEPVFWRVEGSLLNLTAVRPVGYFSWNAQSFLERWARRGAMGALAIARPLFYSTNRAFATRLLHAVLRGVSRDRLDLLGEEYFEYELKPRLKPRGVEKLREVIDRGAQVVLVSQGLDHVMRPLANSLGVSHIVCNRLDFRDGISTGRLLRPVIRPRGAFARFAGNAPDGRRGRSNLLRDLGFTTSELLEQAIQPARRPAHAVQVPVIHLNSHKAAAPLSVRESVRGKNILLIGATGFIGKVWLASLLDEVPEIGRVHLLIRSHRSRTSLERFHKMVEQSPVFDRLAERHGQHFGKFLREHVNVIDGDVTQPGLGISTDVRPELMRNIDLLANCSGLTDFNPDLRDALATNVRATANLLDFLRGSDHAALLHLSTCYVVGRRNGRVVEYLPKNYTPRAVDDFDAQSEWRSLEALVKDTEARAESEEVSEQLRRAAVEKDHAAKDLRGAALDNQIRKNRLRWIRQTLTNAGVQRANELGWPNTYTFTKSLSESLIRNFLDAKPRAAISVVRPAIVESSIKAPFVGWNEGVNTSASLSYLLGTFFRQLPTNESKCLDLVPVDLVCRGMTLVAAALLTRRHARVYQLATSVTNPCNMRRSIELTGLGHRKFYRAQDDLQHRIRAKFDAIPVSKARYEKLSAPAQKQIVQAINRSVEGIPFVRPPLARRERELDKVVKLIELFEPFILLNDHVFEAAHIEWLNALLVPHERADFGYDVRSLDWWDYWINVHIPALRKWCYPLIEGRQPETRAPRSVPLVLRVEEDAAGRADAASGPGS